jgi:hypothetical protein
MGSKYGPLKPLEQIIEEGKTSSTFKFGLLRAMTDWIIEHPDFEDEQDLEIPFAWVAAKFLEYYWPLIVSRNPLPQMPAQRGRGNTRLEAVFYGFIRDVQKQSLLELAERRTIPAPTSEFHWIGLQDHYLHSFDVPERVLDLLVETREIVLDQPARYLPNVGEERKTIFQIVHDGEQGEKARKSAMRRKNAQPIYDAGSLHEALHSDPARIKIPYDLYLQLREVRFCIQTSVITKWAMYIEERDKTRPWNESTYQRLLQTHPDREPAIVRKYREHYQSHGLARHCVLTGSALGATWHIDHLVPWSRYPLNAFWNLVPAKGSVNLEKRNRVLNFLPDIKERYEEHVEGCLASDCTIIKSDVARGFGRIKGPIKTGVVVERFERILNDIQRNTGLKTWPPPNGSL